MVRVWRAVASTLAPGGRVPSCVTTTRTGSRPAASRTVSSGSSRRTVPAPTMTASTRERSSCTARRLSRQLIQRASPPAAATLPSRVTAALYVTSGRPVRWYVRKGAFCSRARAPQRSSARSTSTPPSRSLRRPRPSTCGLGSPRAITARAHSGGHQRIRAGRRLAVVAARLEGAVERRASGALAGLGERHGLGVRLSRRQVPPAADDFSVAHQDGAHQGVGMRAAAASLGQGERLVHIQFVVHTTTPQSMRSRADDAEAPNLLLSSGL